MAYHGIPREALVEPSTGSSTTITGRSGSREPDSSDMTPSPAPSRTAMAAGVGHQIRVVLAVAGPGQTPVPQVAEDLPHGRGCGVEHLDAVPRRPWTDDTGGTPLPVG